MRHASEILIILHNCDQFLHEYKPKRSKMAENLFSSKTYQNVCIFVQEVVKTGNNCQKI